jgi:hypothetical protein
MIGQVLGTFAYPHGERVAVKVHSNVSLLFAPDRIEWLLPGGYYRVEIDREGRARFWLLEESELPPEHKTPVRYDRPITRARRAWRGQL